MCRRVQCSTCGRPTFAGCGAHVEQVLAGVPPEERCRCREQGSRGASRTAGSRSWIVVAGIAVLVAGYLWLRPSGDLSGQDARQLVAQGAVLLDVRTPAEYAGGHLDGAVNIPLQQLADRLTELRPTDRPLVVYCRSGARSRQATELLREAGFGAVHDLGAMDRW